MTNEVESSLCLGEGDSSSDNSSCTWVASLTMCRGNGPNLKG